MEIGIAGLGTAAIFLHSKNSCTAIQSFAIVGILYLISTLKQSLVTNYLTAIH